MRECNSPTLKNYASFCCISTEWVASRARAAVRLEDGHLRCVSVKLRNSQAARLSQEQRLYCDKDLINTLTYEHTNILHITRLWLA
jgi:hypothetical protein